MKKPTILYSSSIFTLLAFLFQSIFPSWGIESFLQRLDNNLNRTSVIEFADNCQDLRNQLTSIIDQANHCKTDSDCGVRDLRSPFSCFDIISEDEDLSFLREGLIKYKENCGDSVPICYRVPKDDELTCQENRCVNEAYVDVYAVVENAQKQEGTELSDCQLWSSALAGILVQINGLDHYRLEMEPKTALAVSMHKDTLDYWWGVTNRDELLETLFWVANIGHSQIFDQYVFLAKQYPDLTPQEKIDLSPTIPLVVEDMSYVDEVIAEVDDNSLYAWDWGRFVYLCRAAYAAGFLERNEAIALIETAGQFISRRFDSWEEFGNNYLIGRLFWGGTSQRPYLKLETERSLKSLQAPNGAWSKIEWEQGCR